MPRVTPYRILRLLLLPILLRLNEYTDKWNAANINVTNILEDANAWNAQQVQPKGDWMPYFSGPLKAPEIPAGNDDEEINLPWFAPADKHLFHYDMHGFTASPLLRAVVPEPGVVEVWSFSVVLKAMNSLFDHVSDDGLMKGYHKPEAWQTLYRTLEKNERSSGLLAIFKLPESAKLRDIVVKELRGEFPSRTYPIRRAMLFLLGPIFSIVFFLFGLLGLLRDSIAPIFPYIVLGLVVYILYRVWRYTSGSAARATKEKKPVWGPTGPMEVKSHSKWFDEEKELGVQRPQTVRLGRSWKR
ncbi:hypothetical protein N0V83_005484 [Neocucurbitaria cava]|uniref:Uncharacterized protein n=1 Tax=Neocucurbitaria cava TaxID=798079 RepID=A0A9W8Y8Z0_9PLEO|nr:hypothetical protein N0V83_005484 [Neocucurbitaria cava]